MKPGPTYYARARADWRRWLDRNGGRAKEIWLVYPKKHTGKPRIAYNDAVDEALCFGWIDSINRALDTDHTAQRFTPRRPGSALSPMNRERARRLIAAGRMRAAGRRAIGDQLKGPRATAIPADILERLRSDPEVWKNFRRFPASYRRIRTGWIEGARRRPAEFEKRLAYFLRMTAKNRKYGMVQ